MKRLEILAIFYESSQPLTPDQVRKRLWTHFAFPKRVSVYSYLLRLHKQGLLVRRFIKERLAYEISDRGVARFKYLREKDR
jgi:DNA-binding PadR family transcriptional regulator